MKKINLFLITIFLLGIFLRFYKLGDAPVSLHRDEAFLGYNAYSILKTGRDMSGKFLPLHLESFIYSPAGYSYFSIPFIAVFNLSEFSIRFASAFFGSLTILLIYFLVLEFFKKYQLKSQVPASQIGLFASFLLALSPWHINLSRTATENTIVVFFISLGILFYIFWTKNNKLLFLVGAFASFAVTIFIYQAPRVFLPLFIPLMIIAFLERRINKRNIFNLVILYLFLIIIPLFFILSSKELTLRIRTVSIFSTEETQLVTNDQILTDGVFKTPIIFSRVFHNKIIMYTQQLLKNYFTHFSYQFLFTDQGYPERYKVPLMGLVYIIELPFLIYGAWKLISENKRIAIFLLGWILLAPLGSALTFDDIPNLQRTLIIFPALSIVSAYGIFSLFFNYKYRLVKIVMVISIFAFFYNFLFYLHQYYIHGLVYRPWYRQDGYKELVQKVNYLLPDFQKAIITNRESAPTIFFLFYSKYDPKSFQLETKGSTMRDFDRISFGKYQFSQEECPLRAIKNELTGEREVVYVNSGLCNEAVNGVKTLDIIKRTDSSTVFHIVGPK